jgi:hypothetical protein
MRHWLALPLVLCALACSRAEVKPLGVGARVTLDRSETRVGDPVGVTVEIETPPGFSVQPPATPSGGAFASDSVELLPPRPVPGGLRHDLLWTVRAREIGDQLLPWLEVPLVRPDGVAQSLRVGGVPLPVRSVRSALAKQEALFDIRDAPPDPPPPPWVFALAALCLALLALAVQLLRRRARLAEQRATALVRIARETLGALDGAETESDAREFAGRVRRALVLFIAACWRVDTRSATPGELPSDVDAELIAILRQMEAARFAPRPVLPPIVGLAELARERVRHVAKLRA